MLIYEHTLTSTLINNILQELGDSDSVTWTREEVLAAIKEGIQVLNVLGYFTRNQISVSIPQNTSFLDALTIADFNDYIGFTKSKDEIKYELDRHLLEDAVSQATISNEVFDRGQYDTRLEKRVNEFLLQTGLIIKRDLVNLPIDSQEHELSLSILNIRRLSILAGGKYKLLRSETEANISAFFSSGSINAVQYPLFFSKTTTKKNIIRLYPPLSNAAQLEILAIYKPIYADSITLQVVSDFAWVVKYGVLYDYFSDEGAGKDEKRAEYCKQRWEMGIQIAKNYPLILSGKIANLPIRFDDVFNLDKYDANWENVEITSAAYLSRIRTLAVMSWNMFAIPAKLANPLNADITLDILGNAIIPAVEVDYIQIPFEFISILDVYSQHYLLLKLGTEDFYAGMDKLNRLLESLLEENQRLNVPGNEFFRIGIKKNREVVHRPIQEERAA